MIHPNELRLGNYILVNNETIQIDEDFLEDLMGSRNYDSLQPIELTPEIFESAGFEKTERSKNPYRLRGFGGYLYAYVWGEKYYCFYVEKLGRVCLSEPGRRYLHQLQNLFFALTGKELEIKLPVHS